MPASLLSAEVHAERRARLLSELDRPVLLLGNGEQPRNLPISTLPFRQDSNFLYLTGCAIPGSALLLDAQRGARLYLPLPAADDALWHGETPGPEALRAAYGVEEVRDIAELRTHCQEISEPLLTLAISDPVRCAEASAITGMPLDFGVENGSTDLIDTLIHMRRIKTREEIAEHEAAAVVTEAAHRAAMAATHVGGHEREIAALFDAVLAAQGCVPGYGSIVTVRGEVLHNPHYTNPLTAGDLLLLDGGAERASGYGCDVTRTWPVTGQFDPRQRSAYEAVLAAQEASIARCVPGTRYRQVHLASATILAEWMAEEKLLLCSPQEAVDTGAYALFFPHGVGHLLGLDVHDLEQFGDRAAYPNSRTRSSQFGLSYLRLDLDLQEGHLVTIEPGFYAVPAILRDPDLVEKHRGRIDFDRAQSWLGLGGIRIEDDILVTTTSPRSLTGSIPRTISEVEEAVGCGLAPSERFST